MKEFMMIFVGEDYAKLALSPEEIQARMQKWFKWIETLKEEDIYINGKALSSPAKRVSGTDQVVTDGPFVEAKDLVGGYFLIKAESMDAAVALTRDFPDYDLGSSVEVREVMIY